MKKNRKYLWLNILFPVMLVLGSAPFYMASDLVLKELVVVDQLPENLNFDSVIIVVTNRAIVENEFGQKEIENFVDPEGKLKYVLAVEHKDRFDLAFTGDFESLISYMPLENSLIFVHGDGKTLQKTLWRASLMKNEYNVNLLVFSWPTKDPEMNSIKNLKNSITNAELSNRQLSEFIHEYQNLKDQGALGENHRTSILFHSLGNYLLEQAVRENLLADLRDNLFDNVLINAAAVDSEIHSEWLSKLKMQTKIFVVSSTNDVNLMGAQYFTSFPLLLGQEAKGERVSGVEYIDMSDAMGFTFKRSPSHTYFVGEGMTKKNVNGFYHSVIDGNETNWKQYGMQNSKTGSFEIQEENS